jgi:hypothetical protein
MADDRKSEPPRTPPTIRPTAPGGQARHADS